MGRRYGLQRGVASAGLYDLQAGSLALVDGDTPRYAASIPKLLILLAAFEDEQQGRLRIDASIREQLVRMIRMSSNADAAALGRKLGLPHIREVAASPRYHLYDSNHGGIWTGKYFGEDMPADRDPVSNLVHAATARQVLRFYWMLDRGVLVSPDASARMRRIFLDTATPMYPHQFAAAISGRPGLRMLRKSGSDQPDYHCDSALVEGPGRRYIVVCFVRSDGGDEFLREFAVRVDDFMRSGDERGRASTQ
jgi:beta-lactamase class A